MWGLPPADLTWSSDDVHIWRAALDLASSYVSSLQGTLAKDESERAGRFHFQKDREHFIAARGLLRIILSRYTGVQPNEIRFGYSANGKPCLAATSGWDRLSFNLSHSHGLVLYGFTWGREIGVDLERLRTDFSCEQIAERFFSPRENAELRALPATIKHAAFFACWTRKEAYIKARGDGLALPLDQFDVSLAPGQPARLLHVRGDPLEASRWSLQELSPGPGYVAALAVQGHGRQLACWDWRGH